MNEVKSYPNCDICEILPNVSPEMIVTENDYWNVNLRNRDQTLLGTTFITLKRHAYELDQLTPAENESFVEVRDKVIQAIRSSFTPITFNVSCLKNDAFASDPDHTPPEAAHVHWHIKPRYGTQPKIFANDTFLDPSPGRPLTTFERKNVTPATALAIADEIRKFL